MLPIIDPWTLQLEKLLLQIAQTAKEQNKKYYFGGGFAIDLSFGEITRKHEDLDFYPMEEDINWWKVWFQKNGFLISRDPDMRDFPHAFLPTNKNNDYFADVYPIKIGEQGEIMMLWKDGHYGIWKGKSYFDNKKVVYKDVSVYIENPSQVIQQKLDYAQEHAIELSEKHQHDITLYKSLQK
jgi:hypothetical protein